jgi:hypothetical protein
MFLLLEWRLTHSICPWLTPHQISQMIGKAALEDTQHLMMILREAMRDPALSGGCFLLGELFAAIAEQEAARPLLDEVPGWKMPGLLLSAALLFRAFTNTGHPLARYLTDPGLPLNGAFRAAVCRALTEERAELSALLSRHTYQCNPPRRMAVSLLAAAAVIDDWAPALHVDVRTASGIGLLLGEVRIVSGSRLGPPAACLEYPLQLRGSPLNIDALSCPKIERSIGIDLDPPDLGDADCRSWMRACQFPLAAELAFFDQAVDLLLSRNPRVERGSATDLLPGLAKEIPPGQPLIVTDTYVAVFMSEEEREEMRRELDVIAGSRPVVWVSNNPLVPAGRAPERTTAGTSIPPELMERNRRELFGTICVTTWPQGKRKPRIVGFNHPGGCWLEWRPDLAAVEV